MPSLVQSCKVSSLRVYRDLGKQSSYAEVIPAQDTISGFDLNSCEPEPETLNPKPETLNPKP